VIADDIATGYGLMGGEIVECSWRAAGKTMDINARRSKRLCMLASDARMAACSGCCCMNHHLMA
jgi:hypothetical protein